MSSEPQSMTFTSRRKASAPTAPSSVVPDPSEPPVEEPVETHEDPAPVSTEGAKILVISSNNGLGQMIGSALGAEANTQVDYSKNALADLRSEDPAFLDDYTIVVFEAHPGNDLELHCLRTLTAERNGKPKFLAMTTGELTLAYAKDLMDAGVDEVLPLSSIRPDLRDTVELEPAVSDEIKRRGENDRNGLIVGISQTRGGIGATSTTLALAHQLSLPPKAKKRKDPVPDAKRVVVVDFDIQNGNLGAYVDIEDNGRVIEMLRSEMLPNGSDLKAMTVALSDTLDVLPSPVEFAPLESFTPEMIATLLDELRYAYDIVLIDMPRAVSSWLEPMLARADQIIMLTDTAVPSIRQARRLVDLYTEDHVDLAVEVAIALEKKRFSLTETQKEAAQLLGTEFKHWIPRDDASALKANDVGKPISEAAPRSGITKAITSLAEVIEKSHSSDIRRRA